MISLILIVDENRSIGDLVCRIVSLAGYEALFFSSAAVAIDALKVLHPQLIILEYHAHATEVLDYLHTAKLQYIPVLGLVSSQKEAADFITQGAKEVLIKPFRRLTLIAGIEKLLGPK